MWIPGCHHCLACSACALLFTAHTLPSVATFLGDSVKQSQNDTMLNLKMLKSSTRVSWIPVFSEVIPFKKTSRLEFYIHHRQGASSFRETWKVKITISSVFIEWDLLLLKYLLLHLAKEFGIGGQRSRLQNHLAVLICFILVRSALDAMGLDIMVTKISMGVACFYLKIPYNWFWLPNAVIS